MKEAAKKADESSTKTAQNEADVNTVKKAPDASTNTPDGESNESTETVSQ